MSEAAVDTVKMGTPPVVTSEVVSLLEKGARVGLKGLELCGYAGLAKSTYYDYLRNNPDFSAQLDILRTSPVARAREVLVEALESDNAWAQVNAAKYHIDKVDGKAKQNIHIQDDMTITVQRKTYDALPEPCVVLDVVDEDE